MFLLNLVKYKLGCISGPIGVVTRKQVVPRCEDAKTNMGGNEDKHTSIALTFITN